MSTDLKPCPQPGCGSTDIDVDSNSSMRLSEVSCGDCGHKLQAAVCEESIVKRWNKLKRPIPTGNGDTDKGEGNAGS